jgi:hypothetical protein
VHEFKSSRDLSKIYRVTFGGAGHEEHSGLVHRASDDKAHAALALCQPVLDEQRQVDRDRRCDAPLAGSAPGHAPKLANPRRVAAFSTVSQARQVPMSSNPAPSIQRSSSARSISAIAASRLI